MTRVLLGQLNANGDCLYATILARQIKLDHPGCHLTWAVSREASGVLLNNPDIDELWVWDTPDGHRPEQRERAWKSLEVAVLRRQQGSEPFDRICLPQIWPNNFRNYDGTIRSSLLRAYPGPITAPIDSTIRLDADERQGVEDFIRVNRLNGYDHRILFECASTSGQSFMTPDIALRVAELVNNQLPGCCFILSTHRRQATDLANVVWADTLNMRQNAPLTHACDLFVGCGSGLTVVATSEAAAPLPVIQILSARTSVYASFHHDFLYFGKPAGRFIEMGDPDPAAIAAAIVTCRTGGLTAARDAWHRPLPVTFDFYAELIGGWLLDRNRACDALSSLSVTIDRYGPHPSLIRFGHDRILPALADDPLFWDVRLRRQVEERRDRFASLTAEDA